MKTQTKRCYYEVLAIVKPSNEDEIRKSYKKLALKWHPDKNPDSAKEAEEVFKEIGEAYAVLSDKEKKGAYDRFGFDGLTTGGQTPGGNRRPGPFQDFSGGFSYSRADDIFKNLFKTGFFDDDDFFTKHFSPESKPSKRGTPNASPFGGFGRFGKFDSFGFDDPREDPFSSGSVFREFGMNGGNGFASPSSKSTSTSTVIKDGKKVTVSKVTTVGPDGVKKTEIKETVSDANGSKIERHFVEDGKGARTEVKRIK